jgi:hypothetical protein
MRLCAPFAPRACVLMRLMAALIRVTISAPGTVDVTAFSVINHHVPQPRSVGRICRAIQAGRPGSFRRKDKAIWQQRTILKAQNAADMAAQHPAQAPGLGSPGSEGARQGDDACTEDD